MKMHDRLKLFFIEACQNWRAFAYVMQVHENHYIKRAGVAGIRARAGTMDDRFTCMHDHLENLIVLDLSMYFIFGKIRTTEKDLCDDRRVNDQKCRFIYWARTKDVWFIYI
ncbi:hypothetical protein GBC03_10450 [Citrobacter telavivensis]|uniref:Uncharacterized protein n=1 Tax=Citrobacter telavivensis TaxID=2653932 RepID=A0A6L5EHK7_9ENTR|nr:hypothetical protein [Citrobacter telavivensis]QFS70601.1 hypothetical protein GBC03_10450 [Citrobacter telavivensis]